jgi:hypothetical protein
VIESTGSGVVSPGIAAKASLRRPLSLIARRASVRWGLGIFGAALVSTIFLSRYLFWDSYYDLYAGRYIAAHGIPRHEVLTVAARGQDWIDQQWLAHLLYFEAWRFGGFVALALLSSVLIASAFGLLGALLIERGVAPHRALSWSLLAFVICLGSTVIRAQSFSFPLFVAILAVIVFDSVRPRFEWRVALALLLLAIWANLHGAVLIGTAILSGYAVARAWRLRGRDRSSSLRYAALAVAALLCPLVNPYGLGILDYYGALIGNPVLKQFILEWRPQSFDNPFTYGFLAILLVVVGTAAYALGRGYRPPLVLLVPALALGALASQGIRYQVWFALAGVAFAADTLRVVRPAPVALSPRAVRVGAFTLSVLVIASLAILVRTPDSQFERLVPRAATDAAARYANLHPDALILADDEASSALLWRYPQLAGRVGFDARLEQYSRSDLASWFEFMTVSGPDWRRAAAPYDVLVVSSSRRPRLAGRLKDSPAWRVIFDGDDSLVLVRNR